MCNNNISLFNDDCVNILNKDKILQLLDAIIVDPPYFGVVNHEFDRQWAAEEKYLEWLERTIELSVRLLRDGGAFVLFCSRQNVHRIALMCEKHGLVEQRMVIWGRKRCFNQTRGKALASGYEPILYMTKGKDNITFNNIKVLVESKRKEYNSGSLKNGISLSDCWTDIPALPHNAKEKVNHPTQKPLELIKRIISIVTNPNDTVLDYCMGSGTTGVACVDLGRNFVGIEKDKNYFDVAKNRIYQHPAC